MFGESRRFDPEPESDAGEREGKAGPWAEIGDVREGWEIGTPKTGDK